jgi:type I restriction enzyme R subunit
MADYRLPDFDEASSSQIPALLELVNMGYKYLSRSEVRSLRTSGSYVLGDIACSALRAINEDSISSKSIRDAVHDFEQVDMSEGVVKASSEIYSLLLAGRSVLELVDGRRTSPQLKFVDFKEPLRNSFHVCAEFEISEGHDRRPDIVVFVNGFPFAVIECKKESVKLGEAVAQMVRNQCAGQTPKFFLFPQILIGCNVHGLRYGTMLTPERFYAHWKEKDPSSSFSSSVSSVVNKQVPSSVVSAVASDLLRSSYSQAHDRTVTPQDSGIYSLLEPVRMLDLVRNFILYDRGVKKIARYPQYFAVKKALVRLKTFDEYGRRRGGLIWHTQGSGKSLTMVMLVKCLIDDPEIELPRVLVVTDRRTLDKQISKTFAACNIKKDVKRVTNAKELLALLREKDQQVLCSLIHKFDSFSDVDFVDSDPNVFILIDEAHRTQGGKANAALNRILPKACQIAFTGTPLMKREKSSAAKFGGMIDAYTISEAEADNVVLPLIYQPRYVEQTVQKNLLDSFYDRITASLTDSQKKDLQRKFNSSQIVLETSQRIETIALDILDHYSKYADTGLKAQVVAPSKYAAVMFLRAFELQNSVPVAVIISESGDSEEDDKLPEHKKVVADWLAAEKHKFGSSLENRERVLVEDFLENPSGVRILIVVDKLLTGFDAPRNTFLYLARQLRDHNLLQAIARVNRLFEGDPGHESKLHGYIIDYSKNAKNLYDAMALFSNYDPADVERALLNSNEQIAELERLYQELHSLFNSVRNRQDNEEYIRVLEGDLEKREHFYELVNRFIGQFSACGMLQDFPQKFSAEKLTRYQKDLKKFVELKKIQKVKNAEVVDFSKYEDQIRRILDRYVTSEYVVELTEPLCLSEADLFNEYIENSQRGLSDRSKAEAIAAQTKRTISEKYHRDPEFYSRFSDKIEELIAQLKSASREDLALLLEAAKKYQSQVKDYEDSDIPSFIKEEKKYHPFYRGAVPLLEKYSVSQEIICSIVVALHDVIERNMIVDWERNIEVRRKVHREMEDYLFDIVKGNFEIPLDIDTIETLVSKVWELAVENRE